MLASVVQVLVLEIGSLTPFWVHKRSFPDQHLQMLVRVSKSP